MGRRVSHRKVRGGVIVLVALALIALLGMAGLAIDGGFMFVIRQKSQAAADAAALAAAYNIPNGSTMMSQQAKFAADLNNMGGLPAVITLNPAAGGYGGDPTKVEAVNTAFYQPVFLTIVGVNRIRITDRAVGQYRQGVSQFNAFSVGLFGRDYVTFSGNGGVDSYNSNQGSYANQVVGGHAGSRGDVGSNGNITLSGNGTFFGTSTNPGTLTLSGNATIAGALGTTVTAGGSVTMNGNASITRNLVTDGTLSTSGNASVGGSISQNAGVTVPTISLPAVDTSTAAASNNNAAISPQSDLDHSSPPGLSLSGNNSLTLTSGVYYFSSISISGNASLTISGRVVIYVTNSISISGNGFANPSQNPNNLFINYSGTSAVHWSGNADFYGGLYAPNANLSISGNAQAFGGYVAGSIDNSGNGAIHLDRSLAENIASPAQPIYRLTE